LLARWFPGFQKFSGDLPWLSAGSLPWQRHSRQRASKRVSAVLPHFRFVLVDGMFLVKPVLVGAASSEPGSRASSAICQAGVSHVDFRIAVKRSGGCFSSMARMNAEHLTRARAPSHRGYVRTDATARSRDRRQSLRSAACLSPRSRLPQHPPRRAKQRFVILGDYPQACCFF